MKVRDISRPSPALVVAIAALVIATTGTAMAAGHRVKGDSLIKPHSVSGNRLKAHTITRAQINVKRLGTVPKAKTAATARALPPLVWHSFALENGWADYDLTPDPRAPAFAVDAQRIVHLRGIIQCPTADCTGPFAVMPAAFRPSQFIYMAADTSGGSTGRLELDSTGEFYPYDPLDGDPNSLTLTSLDGVTYALG